MKTGKQEYLRLARGLPAGGGPQPSQKLKGVGRGGTGQGNTDLRPSKESGSGGEIEVYSLLGREQGQNLCNVM